MKKSSPDDTFYCGERGSYIHVKEKMMIRTAKDDTKKQKKIKRASVKNTLPPKEPGIRSTPNN